MESVPTSQSLLKAVFHNETIQFTMKLLTDKSFIVNSRKKKKQ